MADRIIHEMKEVQPEGPYSFGGYCYGTLVSIAIAKKLDEMGETYDPIVMIDPQPHAYVNLLDEEVVKSFKQVSFEQRKVHHGSELGNRSSIQSLGYLYEKTVNKLTFTFKRISLEFYVRLKDSVNLNMPYIFRDVELANRVAHDNFVSKLKQDCNADMELLLSKDVTERFTSDPASAWTGITKGTMHVHLIQDDGIIMSGEMFKQPYVQGTAEVIKSIWESKPRKTKSPKNQLTQKEEQNQVENITV